MAKDSGQGAPPAPPTSTGSVSEYISNYPRLIEAQEQYGGRDLASQRAAQEFAYPELAGMSQDLMGQISQGMNESVPDWYASQVQDTLKSQLGRNLVYNPQAQESFGLRTQEAHKGYQDYYRNLAMSMANKQPVFQSQSPTAGYTPQGVMGMQASTYSPYMNAWSGQQNRQFQQSMSNQQMPWMALQGAGNLMSGVGSFGGQGSGFMGLDPLKK